MNIKKVSFGLISASIMAGAFSACSEPKYENKAKEQAVKYLNGDELLKAERFASRQLNYDKYNGEAISYWDSLLIEAKAKEAYAKGQKVIQDSTNGIFFRKEKFKAPLDTIFSPENLIENSRNEYSTYVKAEKFIKSRDKAPKDYIFGFFNNLVGSAHYWNLITMAGKQNESYQKGMADERNRINDSIKTARLPISLQALKRP